MTEAPVVFDDGGAYDAFMGRWSRAVGEVFLDWCAPPRHARWLDVGCGTGIFTELVRATCAPAAMVAVDSSAPQIDYARRRYRARSVDFRVADARTLPFPDASFDVVTAALVLNFVPEPSGALTEMRRVGRARAMVAGYVWNFAAEQSPTGPLARAMRRIAVEPPKIPGADICRLDALQTLFHAAGLEDVATRAIEVRLEFPDFETYWTTQTPAFNPFGKVIAAMAEAERLKLVAAVHEELAPGPDGRIAFTARAHAVKSFVPVSRARL
jgi:SAM-dependent methyltransferase